MRVLVLHSGGMDSTTCLYKARSEGADVFSLGINYGQKISSRAHVCAEALRAVGGTARGHQRELAQA